MDNRPKQAFNLFRVGLAENIYVMDPAKHGLFPEPMTTFSKGFCTFLEEQELKQLSEYIITALKFSDNAKDIKKILEEINAGFKSFAKTKKTDSTSQTVIYKLYQSAVEQLLPLYKKAQDANLNNKLDLINEMNGGINRLFSELTKFNPVTLELEKIPSAVNEQTQERLKLLFSTVDIKGWEKEIKWITEVHNKLQLKLTALKESAGSELDSTRKKEIAREIDAIEIKEQGYRDVLKEMNLLSSLMQTKDKHFTEAYKVLAHANFVVPPSRLGTLQYAIRKSNNYLTDDPNIIAQSLQYNINDKLKIAFPSNKFLKTEKPKQPKVERTKETKPHETTSNVSSKSAPNMNVHPNPLFGKQLPVPKTSPPTSAQETPKITRKESEKKILPPSSTILTREERTRTLSIANRSRSYSNLKVFQAEEEKAKSQKNDTKKEEKKRDSFEKKS